MFVSKRSMFITLFALAFFAWAVPARAADDLIDVVEIIDPAPFIVHTNILPGDTFMDKMTVRNLTSSPQEVLMELDIDLSEGINIFPYELEERLTTRIERVGSGDIVLPGLPVGGTVRKLQELDDTLINLGTIAANSQQEYRIHVVFDINAGNEYQNTKVYFNITMGLEVPELRGSLRLVKSNDSVSDEAPGNEVVYTLEVTALGGDVEDVTVTDLPPEGFAYVPGSGEGAPFVHEYASPGIWNLGDMEEGETKTLTYKTKISGAQDAGLYKDLAFARGVAVGTPIFANSAENPFVGTEVNVVLDTDPTVTVDEEKEEETEKKTKRIVKYVLGAATTLPMTGASVGVVGIALLGIVSGIGLVVLARSRRKKQVLPLLVLCVLGTLGMMPEQAAAATLSVKIETPEAVTATPNMQIGFVVLDVLGRPLTVECYQGSEVVPFATYPLASSFGGNSGNCQVNSTVMPTDGSYEFFVKAIATGEGSETVESNHVSVTLASSVPGTPYNYDRDDNSCQNVITFTTADDGGKTVKVELYRSTEGTFTADASTKVDELAIGSNASGSFVKTPPGCDDDVFYALRAVDAFGHGSGFVGDKDIDVDTKTETTTKTTTVTVPGAATGQSGAIPVAPAPEGQVEGATTTNPEAEAADSRDQEGSAAVLGEMTESQDEEGTWAMLENHPWWSLVIFLIAALLGYFGYQSYRRNHEQPLQ